MNTPRSFIRNRFFEVCTTVFVKPRKKIIEFYHKRLSWWINIYGVRFKHIGLYVILKKVCL
jgi:hypothetical protein